MAHERPRCEFCGAVGTTGKNGYAKCSDCGKQKSRDNQPNRTLGFWDYIFLTVISVSIIWGVITFIMDVKITFEKVGMLVILFFGLCFIYALLTAKRTF